MADLYDVVFLGVNSEDPEARETALHAIAQMLDANVDELRQLAENGIGSAVKYAVPLAEARQWQTEIVQLGGLCNYRPANKLSRKLELTPLEALQVTLTFACPACDYQQTVEREADMPLQCPTCGVIPSKYDKMAALKEERERIKRRLLHAQKVQDEHERQLATQLAEDARRRELEDEIRRELGLPRALNSRGRIVGSAAVLWLFGIGIGVGATLFLQESRQLGAGDGGAGIDLVGTLSEGILRLPANDLALPPAQDTLQQVHAYNRTMRSLHTDTGTTGNANSTSTKTNSSRLTTSPVFTTLAADDSVPPPPIASDNLLATLDSGQLLQELAKDREWDGFLAAQTVKLTNAGDPAKAYAIASLIRSTAIKTRALCYLAEYFQSIKDTLNGDNLYAQMVSIIASQPDMQRRIEAQGLLALSLAQRGETQKLMQQLDEAEKLASNSPTPAESAEGLGRVAVYQALTGQQALADANFRRVNSIIHGLGDKNAMLYAYAKLATAYAEAGNRAVANAILNETLNATENLQGSADYAPLLAELVSGFVRAGDADAALAAAAKGELSGRDPHVYAAVAELAFTGRLYDAMKGVDRLSAPAYKARAAALISRLQHEQPETAGHAAATLEKATAALTQITNLHDQTIARGEMARYLAHSGNASAAEDWGKKAIASAQSLASGAERETALSLLAAHLARANLPKLAEDAVKLLAAPSAQESVRGEISQVNAVFSQL